MLELKERPAEVRQWSQAWSGGQSVFVYETFLYVVAALIRGEGFDVLRSVFETQYMLPETARYGGSFGRFDRFQGHSEVLSTALATPDGRRYLSAEGGAYQTSSDQNRHPVQGDHGGRTARLYGRPDEGRYLVVSGVATLRGLQLGSAVLSARDQACRFREARNEPWASTMRWLCARRSERRVRRSSRSMVAHWASGCPEAS